MCLFTHNAPSHDHLNTKGHKEASAKYFQILAGSCKRPCPFSPTVSDAYVCGEVGSIPSTATTCSRGMHKQRVCGCLSQYPQKAHVRCRTQLTHFRIVAPNLRPVSHNSGSSAIAWMDRNALVALYHSTGGADCWRNSENWDSEDDVSTWYGVKVDDEGRVVALHLGHNNLAGKIF